MGIAEADMADEPEDPDAAADRLEAALERIARLAAAQAAQVHAAQAAQVHAAQAAQVHAAEAAQVHAARLSANAPPPDSDLSIPEIAERLDSLIGRLRAALGKTQ